MQVNNSGMKPDTEEAPAYPPAPPLMELWGIGREVFESLGGGEAFLREERRQFHGCGNDSVSRPI
jgi:hypothetical protein